MFIWKRDTTERYSKWIVPKLKGQMGIKAHVIVMEVR